MEIQELNSTASELTKDATNEQAAVIKDPVNDINKRWDLLNDNLAKRMVCSSNFLHCLRKSSKVFDTPQVVNCFKVESDAALLPS